MLVFTQTILPYIYTRGVSELKKQSRQQPTIELEQKGSMKQNLSHFVKKNITHLQDFFTKNVRPIHLAIFYFFGAYYSFSKRFAGIRYVKYKFFA